MRTLLVREETDPFPEALMNKNVKEAFRTMSAEQLLAYYRYWSQLTVKDEKQYFQRFLFAFCSVHTGWKSNVRGYQAIQDYHPDTWTGDDLRSALVSSGVGMHNNRAKYIYEFGHKFWADPKTWMPPPGEPLFYVRNRLERGIKGLGLAKTSFALELAYPVARTLDIACLDVHMLRLYGLKQRKNDISYKEAEADWVGRSSAIGLAPYITRMVYWDQLQKQTSSRYWSYCLEDYDQQTADEAAGGSLVSPTPRTPNSPDHASGHASEAHAERRDEAQAIYAGAENAD